VRGSSSFPRSAWERKSATLCVAAAPTDRARPLLSLDAERPDVRSHAERGNEGVAAAPVRRYNSVAVNGRA
jgi:hypothetical protein